MDKKIIFLELPIDVIEKIDERNPAGSRSVFISEMLEKQMQNQISKMHETSEIPSSMHAEELNQSSGEINIVDSTGRLLGKFDINTVKGFESLAEKICEISNDPIVRMKAQSMQ